MHQNAEIIFRGAAMNVQSIKDKLNFEPLVSELKLQQPLEKNYAEMEKDDSRNTVNAVWEELKNETW